MCIRNLHRVFASALFFAAIAATAPAQTDVALSFFGAFSNTATSSFILRQTPSSQAGGMIELRHLVNPLIGFEATYSFNRANQNYLFNPPYDLCPNPACQFSNTVSANAHEITADWMPSMKFGSLRPFAVLGVGLLVTVPTGSQTLAQYSPAPLTSTNAVYVYGAGADWDLAPHLGLRVQYRGNLYKAPDVSSTFMMSGPDAFLHTAEPMIGAYFRF